MDIILLLPDSAFSSWEWKIEERTEWYNQIKSQNFYIDENPDYLNQDYLKPNTAGFSIVDGAWTISIYKTIENSFIVITDDLVADGNTINIYEVKSNKIKEYLNYTELFGDFVEQLKLENSAQSCIDKYEELNDLIINFDFSDTSKAEIESSWYLSKDEYKYCLKGNSILYNFNSKTKKFEIDKIYWKPKNAN